MFVEQERWFSFTPDYRPVNDRPVKTDDFEVVVQLHKKFVGATLCGRPFRPSTGSGRGEPVEPRRADTQVCPYVDASLNPN
jgi:hypothetical protein